MNQLCRGGVEEVLVGVGEIWKLESEPVLEMSVRHNTRLASLRCAAGVELNCLRFAWQVQ